MDVIRSRYMSMKAKSIVLTEYLGLPPTRTAVLILNPPSRTAYIQALKKILWASSSAEEPAKNQKVNFYTLFGIF